MSQILTVAANSAPSWSSLSNLWDSLTALQWAAVVSAAILALGAVIEYWSKLKTLAILGIKWILRRSPPFDRCVFRKLFAHSIGPILVVAGIAGEVVFEGRAFIVEDKQTVESEGRTASLEARASADELKAAQLEKANLELEDLIQPRDLSPEEQKHLKDELKSFSGRTISLRSYAIDTEAKRLGKLLEPIFEEAGLTVVDNLGNLMNLAGNVVEGVQIAGPHSQDDLIQALLNSPLTTDPKLKMFRKDDPKIAPNALVEILIGVKPISPVVSQELEKIEQTVLAQGPRSKLLTDATPELVRQLAPFAGQRVELFVCGQQGLAHQETLDTWGAIANILGSDTVLGVTGAQWKEVPTNLNWARNCGASQGLGQGVGVMVSKSAPKPVLEAATVLGHGLAKVLPRSPDKSPGLIDPDFARMTVDRGFMPKDAPWTITAFDPDLIVVVIGEHP